MFISENEICCRLTRSIMAEGSEFVCIQCNKSFTTSRALERHKSFTCKGQVKVCEELLVPRVQVPPDPELELVHYDDELDGLLASVGSDYTRWRLSQVLKVTQRDTYPVLWNYKYPGSRSSPRAAKHVIPLE